MKILIVTEIIAGNGHYKAAVNLKKAFLNNDKQNDVEIITIISLLSKTIEKIISKIYLALITSQPKLWGWIYRKESKFSLVFRNMIAVFLVYGLKKYIVQQKPEVVLATHASGLGALSLLKKKHHFKLGAAFTDFNINSFWINKDIDYYFVGHSSLKEQLVQKYKINANRIYVTGIPIDPHFAATKHVALQGTRRKPFSVLIMGGGLGLGGIKEIVEALSTIQIDAPFSLRVITGTNQKLYDQLVKIKKQIPYNMELYQYVEDIKSLMIGSQVIITKAGGLTTSEALSIPIPILLYRPLPGQEEKNTHFLLKHHAAILTNTPELVSYWIKYLHQNQKLYFKLKDHAKRIAKPNASQIIVQVIENELYQYDSERKETAHQGL